MVTLSLVLVLVALVCSVLALLGVASRVDLTAVAVVALAINELIGLIG